MDKDVTFYGNTKQWRDIVGRCDALNQEAGTEKVSKHMVHNRRRRARQREDLPTAPAVQEEPTSDNRHAIAMQEEMNRCGFGAIR